MFYITEKLRGTEEIPKALKFGQDDVYDYYISGCNTPMVKKDGYYERGETDRWNDYKQKYRLDDFFTQFKSISKRENFRLLSKDFKSVL